MEIAKEIFAIIDKITDEIDKQILLKHIEELETDRERLIKSNETYSRIIKELTIKGE